MKSLEKHRSAFDQLRPSFSCLSLFQPRLRGEIDGYLAEMGIIWEGESKSVLYKVKLKKSLNIPWFFWDKFLLSNAGYGTLEIQKRQWLTQYAYHGETMREISKQLDGAKTEAVKASFRHLVHLAGKIDSGEVSIDSKLAEQKKRFYKDSLIVAGVILLAAVLVAGWWYLS